MSDMLRDRGIFLEAQRNSFAASPVEYRKLGGATITAINATRGKTGFNQTDENGFQIGGTIIDFLILSDDLGAEPERGDIIVDSGRKYEVLPLGLNGSWRWSEPGITYRIHTRDIGASA